MKEIKLYKSPLKAVRLILLSSIFVIGGILGINNGFQPAWVNWLCICFFGLGYPVALFNLFDRRPKIIINELGIFDRAVHKDFINWEIIRGAYIIDIHRQKFICLVVDEEFKPSRKKSKFSRKIAALNEAIGAQELNINLSEIKIDVNRFAEFILLMRNATKPERDSLLVKAIKEWN